GLGAQHAKGPSPPGRERRVEGVVGDDAEVPHGLAELRNSDRIRGQEWAIEERGSRVRLAERQAVAEAVAPRQAAERVARVRVDGEGHGVTPRARPRRLGYPSG